MASFLLFPKYHKVYIFLPPQPMEYMFISISIGNASCYIIQTTKLEPPPEAASSRAASVNTERPPACFPPAHIAATGPRPADVAATCRFFVGPSVRARKMMSMWHVYPSPLFSYVADTLAIS